MLVQLDTVSCGRFSR